MKKRIFALLLAAVMLFGALAACAQDETPQPTPAPQTPETPQTPTDPSDPTPPASQFGRDPYVAPPVEQNLPRNETLFFGGLMWSPVGAWTPFHSNTANFSINEVGGGSRTPLYETAYMYNTLNDDMLPLLADGPFEWSSDMTELTYKIKPAAYWSDGTKITAHDAAFTWYFGQYTPGGNGEFAPFVADVVALDDETVAVRAVMAGSVPVFARNVERYIYQSYILQKAWLEDVLDRFDRDTAQIGEYDGLDENGNMEFVWSGPYTRYFTDDTRIVLIRDDGYWGQDASMWGSLPVPKYLAALRYPTNDAIAAALAAGDIDVCQAFIANVHLMWEEDGLPISTFIDRPPYGISANMPTAHFNMAVPVLRDHVELRRAIAMAVDYDAINASAMTFQSPTFAQVPRSLFVPGAEQDLYDQSAVAHLQWVGRQIDEANEILDETGLFPRGADGFRTYEGQRLSFVASCPTGWSDWEASLEIVAAAGEAIGIEITTNFVSEGEFWDFTTAEPPTADTPGIFMFWTPSLSRVSGWDRTRWLISDERLDTWPHNWSGANYSLYSNPRATEIVRLIPLEQDPAVLRALYTEAVEIYLTDVPSFSLMYRPDMFHSVNESVWTGFTEQGDGRNVPPMNCLNGYAIRDLFDLRLVG